MSTNEHYLLIFDVKSKLYRHIQAVLVVVQLWKVLPGHYDRPKISLNGNLTEMHGK